MRLSGGFVILSIICTFIFQNLNFLTLFLFQVQPLSCLDINDTSMSSEKTINVYFVVIDSGSREWLNQSYRFSQVRNRTTHLFKYQGKDRHKYLSHPVPTPETNFSPSSAIQSFILTNNKLSESAKKQTKRNSDENEK